MKKIMVMMLSLLSCGFLTVYTMNQDFEIVVSNFVNLDDSSMSQMQFLNKSGLKHMQCLQMSAILRRISMQDASSISNVPGIKSYKYEAGLRTLPTTPEKNDKAVVIGTMIIHGKEDAQPSLLHEEGCKLARRLEDELGISSTAVKVLM